MVIFWSMLSSGCGIEGPFCGVTQICEENHHIAFIASRGYRYENLLIWGDEPPERFEYAFMPLDCGIHPRSGSESFKWLAATDLRGSARFYVIQGQSSSWIIVCDRGSGTREIWRVAGKNEHSQLLCQVGPDHRFNEYGHVAAIAITRSGHYLLVVDHHALKIIDTVSDAVIVNVPNHPLVEALEANVQQFGDVGRWWLSDDLRFIAIAPPDEFGTSQAMPIDLCGNHLELAKSGLLYDRLAKSAIAIDLKKDHATPSDDSSTTLDDVESVNGQPLLLYNARGRSTSRGLSITTADRRVIFQNKLTVASAIPPVVDFHWSTDAKRVYLLAGPDQESIDGITKECNAVATWKLITWDYGRDVVEIKNVLRGAEIQNAMKKK